MSNIQPPITKFTYLGIQYSIPGFPQELVDQLVSDEEALSMSEEQYSEYCERLTDLAYDLLIWDESEDEILSPDYPYVMTLILEGQPL